jgi:hypothetical protein
MENIFWSGFTNKERHAAIDEINRVISRHGDVVDIHLFSDISMSMTIEIEELKIDRLYEALSQPIGLEKFNPLNSNSKRERKIYLNITFTKGTGDLKIEVPSVPG